MWKHITRTEQNMKTLTIQLSGKPRLSCVTLRAVMLLIFAIGCASANAAQPPRYVEGELLVKFKGGPRGPAAAVARDRMKHELKHNFDFIGWQHIRLPRGMSVDQALARYKQLPGVLAAEPNYIAQATDSAPESVSITTGLAASPNDPRFSLQWALPRIGASNAWNVTTGSSNLVVAVLDTGILYDHEDLRDNMWRNPGEIPANGVDDDGNGHVDDVYGIDTADDEFGNDSDPLDQPVAGATPFYHGTATAGVIGAVANNGKGIAGLNWSVRLMAVRVIRATNWIAGHEQIRALEYCVLMKQRGVNLKVINMSYFIDSDLSQAVSDAHDAVGNAGILQVVAAGNFATNNDVVPIFPANYLSAGLISVANSDQNDNLVPRSNYGLTNVDLAAPGRGIPTTFGPDTNSYASVNGTSFSSPHVAGAAALLFALKPDATVEEVKSALLESVDQFPAFTNKMVSHGRLNVYRPMHRFGPRLTLTADGSGGYWIRFEGAPDVVYRLQRATNVTGSWDTIATLAAPTVGLIEHHDMPPPNGHAFYRVALP